jgi:pyruvate dehydrogenase E2 component (dihydrolipoamide acetyltransferase)
MITPVAMPQMGLEVTEAVVAAIHVAVGARVAEGDPLLELETDKALTDVLAPRGGLMRSVEVQVGDTVAVGDTLLLLADDLADDPAQDDPAQDDPAQDDPAQDDPAEGSRPVLAASAAPSATAVPTAPAGRGTSDAAAAPDLRDGRLRAAPVARRAAERLGVSLHEVVGSGPLGRITLSDVERHPSARLAPAAATPPALAEQSVEPLSGPRRAIARRMTQSQQIPQFALNREIDATWLLAEKQRLAAGGEVGVSVNDLLAQALAETVLRHPDLARSYVDSPEGAAKACYRRGEGVDVGLAVATSRGLLVPVLRRVHERPLRELASERLRLVEAARSGRLALEEMNGATITLSSLAGFGVDSFTAMLNPGESAILAVGRTVERVLPRERAIAIVATLTLTLTIDHRVMDGASGGAALAELADLLEGAMTWRT